MINGWEIIKLIGKLGWMLILVLLFILINWVNELL